MTNNTQNTQPTADEIRSMKRDELRKFAAKIGIKGAAKLSRDNLNIVVINELAAQQPADEKKTERVRTSHADCKHASTKVARAKCRRERARKNV